MAYQTLQLTGGVNVNETQALNEASISSTQLIRFKPDPKGLVLVEKLGGWAKFYANQVTSVIRALLGWEDTDANKWVAYGTSSTTASSLTAIECFANASGVYTASTNANNIFDLTPQYISNLTPVKFTTVAGSSQITITDATAVLTGNLSSVYITSLISVGGVALLGQYQVSNVTPGNKTYTVTAQNTLLGTEVAAIFSTVASPIAITGGSVVLGTPNTVTFTFATLGSAPFPINDNVNFSGITPSSWNGSGVVTACTTSSVTLLTYQPISGTYTSGGTLSDYGVTPLFVPNANSFDVTVIFPSGGYSVGDTLSILTPVQVAGLSLYGNYIITSVPNAYSFTIASPSVPTGTSNAFAGSLPVTGGSSTTSSVTLTCNSIQFSPPTITISGGTSTTSAVTLTWTNPTFNNIAVGTTVYVSGISSPSAWNGSFVVTGSTSTSVTYALSGAATSWGGGGTIGFPLFVINQSIYVQGVSPSAWNGVYTVTSSTPTTVTYALSGSALSWVSGGALSLIGGNANLVYNTALGAYSSGKLYGAVGKPVFASTWSLDNWGEILISCPIGMAPITAANGQNVTFSPFYAWDPISGQSAASVISAGPPASTGFFVAMPQRQIVAWGTTFEGVIDPLLVRWCDVSNYNVWIGNITNQAGSYRLSTGSSIVGAMQGQQQGMIWTDIGLWSMQYIGPPYVYSFTQLGIGCGLIARKAAGFLNGVTYWMGRSQFFMFAGEGVQPIVCPIWDVAFQDLDLANLSKITIAVNSMFNEVTWYYPVAGGNGENSAYIRYNAQMGVWDFGTLSRTAWLDTSVLGPPIGYDPVNQYLYQHEISPDADGQALSASFTTGYFAVAESDEKAFIDQVRPDMKWGYYNQTQNASVQITFNAVDYAGQTPTTYGPFTVSQSTTFFSPRIRARLISVTVSSSDTGTWWRLGAIRYRVIPDGKF